MPTERRKLVVPCQSVTSEHLPIRLCPSDQLVWVCEVEGAFLRLRRLPFLAVLGNMKPELISIVDDDLVRTVVEEIGIRSCTEEELSGADHEGVQALWLLSLGGDFAASADQQSRSHRQSSQQAAHFDGLFLVS